MTKTTEITTIQTTDIRPSECCPDQDAVDVRFEVAGVTGECTLWWEPYNVSYAPYGDNVDMWLADARRYSDDTVAAILDACVQAANAAR